LDFLIPITIITGTPRYIPRFNAITDNPSPRTSDSDSAFSIIANDDNSGVKPTSSQGLADCE